MKLYKYLYYRLYSWNLKTWGSNDLPQYNALLGVSFMMILNFSIIAGILDIFVLDIFIKDTPGIKLVVFFTIVVLINYFWLVNKGRYCQIVEKFDKEPKKRRLRNTILLWLYLVLSFIIVIIIAVLSGQFERLH